MTYRFSKRSLRNLEGVDPRLVEMAHIAIKITQIDFAVTEGLRSIDRQRELVAKGASTTMQSKHLTGNAIDVVAYLGNRISWELSLYTKIADAFKAAALEVGVPVRWGAAWNIPDIRAWDSTMEDAMNFYIDTRRRQNRRVFLDGPHYELN